MPALKRSYPLKWHLVFLVLAAIIPFFIFSALMVDELVDRERAASERRLQKAAQDLAKSLDMEIATTLRTLQALTVSKNLQTHNFNAYHDELFRILKTQPTWLTILVHANEDSPFLSAVRPFGSKLASAEPISVREVFATGRSIVSRVVKVPPVISPLANRTAFAVRVPIIENGRTTYVLSAVIGTESLQKIVTSFSSPEEWTRTIVDHTGTFAARSRNPEKFVGTRVREASLKRVTESNEFFVRATALEGEVVYGYNIRAPLSKWLVGVGVPASVIEAPATRARATLTLGGILLLIVFGGVATLYSRSLAKAIQSATNGAAELAKGHVPIVRQSSVSEVEQLRTSLLTTAELLQTKDRAKSEFLANMSHELRTPLGIVMGMTDLIENDSADSSIKSERLAIVRRNAQHLLNLVNDMLDFSLRIRLPHNLDFLRQILVKSIVDLSVSGSNACRSQV